MTNKQLGVLLNKIKFERYPNPDICTRPELSEMVVKTYIRCFRQKKDEDR